MMNIPSSTILENGPALRSSEYKHVYGPVPSRRLGRSLGIDLVPLKTCTYDCVYCQLGRTTHKVIERREYVPIDNVLKEVKQKLEEGNPIDYISLAGSGEPTLNSGIKDLITGIKELTDIPLAVLTNGSLLWMKEVQSDLMAADVVLPSLDVGDEKLFRHINRPHHEISFLRLVNGIRDFTKYFHGEVWLEILLTAGLTGLPSEVRKISSIVKRICPEKVQLGTVTRPPVMDFALPVPYEDLKSLSGLFEGNVEIIGDSCFNPSDNQVLTTINDEDFLALLRRRPCTYEDVAHGLGIHVSESLKTLNALANTGRIKVVNNHGHNYYTISDSVDL